MDDINTFCDATLRLLLVEASADAEQHPSASAEVRCRVVSLRPGLYGRLFLRVSTKMVGTEDPGRLSAASSSSSITAKPLRRGDVVRGSLKGGGGSFFSGVVSRASGRDGVATVEVGSGELDGVDIGVAGSSITLTLLPSDISFKRMQAGISQLRRHAARGAGERRGGGSSCALVDVAFRRAPPTEVVGLPFTPFAPHLNVSQRSAVAHCLASRDLALIHGPPGTGKTTTVVELIRQAVASGMRVLACAASNVAVDNLAVQLGAVLAGEESTQAKDAETDSEEEDEEENGGYSDPSDDEEEGRRAALQHRRARMRELRAQRTCAIDAARGDPAAIARARGRHVRIVRVGHPARIVRGALRYSLDAQVHASATNEVVGDVRRELGFARERLTALRLAREEQQQEKQQQSRKGNKGGSGKKTKKKKKKTHSAGSGSCSKKGLRGDAACERLAMLTAKGLNVEMRRLRTELRRREERLRDEVIRSQDVVLCTNSGAALLSKLTPRLAFDLVVIDEAAQALEAECWTPLLLAPRAVLAGDHKQLAPTIKSAAAASGGLDLTLFERCAQFLPAAAVRLLETQYRMHDAIASWASAASYECQLLSDASVAARTLTELPHVERCDATVPALLFIDTAGCEMREVQREGSSAAHSHRNEREAALVVAHVAALLAAGLLPSQVAVVTPYTGQVAAVRARLLDALPDANIAEAIEVRTVDGFQGREKEAIVMSMVRSNLRGDCGFLKDKRRINVAATRAKRQLCIVGDSATLSHDAFIGGLLSHARERGVVRCPEELGFTRESDANPPPTLSAEGGGARRALPGSVDDDTRDAALRERVVSRVRAFAAQSSSSLVFAQGRVVSKQRVLRFPATLSSYERLIVHEEAESLGLMHRSVGEGELRFIEVRNPAADAAATAATAAVVQPREDAAPSPLRVEVRLTVREDGEEEEVEVGGGDDDEDEESAPSAGCVSAFAALGSSSSSDEEGDAADNAAGKAAPPLPPMEKPTSTSAPKPKPKTKAKKKKGKKRKTAKGKKATQGKATEDDDDDWAALESALAENTKRLPFGGDVPRHLQGLTGFNLKTLHDDTAGPKRLSRREQQRQDALKLQMRRKKAVLVSARSSDAQKKAKKAGARGGKKKQRGRKKKK
tara:strand:+ start:1087 stop:4500 length:3414 start_codon:yes stop_codon:yes gene_type:complete